MTKDEKELRMWKIEGPACLEIEEMVNGYAEQAKFLNKSVQDAKKKLDDHMHASNKTLWDRIKSELGLTEADTQGACLHIDTDTAKTGVMIVRERRHEHSFLDMLFGAQH